MSLISFHFLVFLIIVLIGYNLTPKKIELLALASLIFLGLYSLLGVVMLVGISLLVHLSLKKAKNFKRLSILAIISCLVLVRLALFPEINEFAFVGLSYYGLKSIALIVKANKTELELRPNFYQTLYYLGSFKTITSGPIHSPQFILNQLPNLKGSTINDIILGAKHIIWGLFFKLVIANNLSMFVLDQLYQHHDYSSININYLFIQSFFVYFDFYAYSILAIGIGRLFGFEIMKNFDRPYSQLSFVNFWRHWHISLSEWLRDFIYIPLGGKKSSLYGINIAVFLTFLVSGLWHAISLNFIIWCLIHFILYSVDKNFEKLSNTPIRLFINFYILSLTWVIFLQADLTIVIEVLVKSIPSTFQELGFMLFSPLTLITILLVLIYYTEPFIFRHYVRDSYGSLKHSVSEYLISTCLLVCLVLYGGLSNQQFLYFNY
ncbi:MAG: hypothetical protein HEP71_22200 [Roseivirga sp.]|nr:hypothetical protein [Roseivirga sp.]